MGNSIRRKWVIIYLLKVLFCVRSRLCESGQVLCLFFIFYLNFYWGGGGGVKPGTVAPNFFILSNQTTCRSVNFMGRCLLMPESAHEAGGPTAPISAFFNFYLV